MGFQNNGYVTVWEVKYLTERMTKARISSSYKDPHTEKYTQDFGGYVTFIGAEVAAKALRLQPRDRIKLGDIKVTNKFVEEKNVVYHNFIVLSFQTSEEAERDRGHNGERRSSSSATKATPKASPSEPEAFDSDGDLPF